VKAFHLYRGFSRKTAYIGDVIRGSVKRKRPTCRIRKGARVHGVVMHANWYLHKNDGLSFKFFKNNFVVLKKRMTPKGPELFGPAVFCVKRRKFINTFSGILY
jgi:ribosomal protein L14